jgi:manganese transport protein
MKILELFLGILTAVGGFVEIGEIVFMSQAGARFGYRLLWVVALGTVGIILFGEMSGRIGAVTQQPVFYLIRQRAGFAAGLAALAAANMVSLLTCAAEIGGMAIVLKLIAGVSYRLLLLAALVFLLVSVWFLPFRWIERVFGLLGLCLIVFPIGVWRLHGDWSGVMKGLIPSLPATDSVTLYAYYAVGILSSILLPYEIYFYSSGGIEDDWKPSDVPMDRVTAGVGFTLGSVLASAILIGSAIVFLPRDIVPESPGMAALMVTETFGQRGLLLALAGMFFAFAGAAIETALSGAYNTAQFFGWSWGKFRRPKDAPRFTLAWIGVFILSAAIMLAGVDAVAMVEYAVIFSVVILPLSYLPVLLIAADKRIMREYVNGTFLNVIGWCYWIVLTLAALAAIPLLLLTHGGKG